jgi:hypothetical protein
LQKVGLFSCFLLLKFTNMKLDRKLKDRSKVMNTVQKYLTLLVTAAMLVSTVGVVTARHGGGHRGGYYHGGRGWGGGYGLGLGLGYGYGYGWPYYGVGYPGFYSRPSYAKDNAGQSYWMVYNQSVRPLRVQSDRDETIIPAGAIKKLYRKNSFNMRVYSGGLVRGINTRQHNVALYLDEIGKPHFKL